MATTSSMVIKAYLRIENEPVEVRRFKLDDLRSNDFVRLHREIKSRFPALEQKEFKITWNDEDGDTITMSSDVEMREAVEHCDIDAVLKVNVYIQQTLITTAIKLSPAMTFVATPKAAAEPSSASCAGAEAKPESEIHPNVVCDGCDQAVKGSRFKCLQCDDYDLCLTCFNKDMHPNHDMIRIVSSNRTLQSERWFWPMRHVWSRLARKALHHQEKFEHKQAKLEAKSLGRHRYHGLHHKDRYTQKTSDEEETSHSNEAREQSSELLRCIGQTVANLLDPLGINVSIDVENSDGEIEAVTKKDKTDSAASGATCAPPAAVPTEKNQNEVEVLEPVNAVEKKMKTVTIEEQTNPENGWTMIPPNQEPVAMDTESPQIQGDILVPIVVSPPNALQAAASATAATYKPKPIMRPVLNTALYPNLDTVLDPKVEGALHHMLAMGYSNEGGWLSALLKAKNADIAAVLDVLHPNCQQ